MLLKEQLRRMENEENLIDDPTEYTLGSAFPYVWVTLHNYGSITLKVPGYLLFRYTYTVDRETGHATNHRLKIGNVYVAGYMIATTSTGTIFGMVYLQAGTYTVIMEAITSLATVFIKIKNMQIGLLDIADVDYEQLQNYSIPLTVNQKARKTVIGTIKNGVLHVRCHAYTTGDQTNFENVGDAYTNGVSIFVNGIQRNWVTRNQDTGFAVVYGSASATFNICLSAGETHTVTIVKDNPATIIGISVNMCPWILATVAYEPIVLSMPNGIVFYAFFEPCMNNPTKYSKIGKKKAISFGDTTDFHSIVSGVDILGHSYFFEFLKPVGATWQIYGHGGLVSHIGVDVP